MEFHSLNEEADPVHVILSTEPDPQSLDDPFEASHAFAYEIPTEYAHQLIAYNLYGTVLSIHFVGVSHEL